MIFKEIIQFESLLYQSPLSVKHMMNFTVLIELSLCIIIIVQFGYLKSEGHEDFKGTPHFHYMSHKARPSDQNPGVTQQLAASLCISFPTTKCPRVKPEI